MSRLTIIVAATNSNGIGQNSRLPWRLPKEMKYFAHATSTAPAGRVNAVIMGRNTWESIPKKFRPLSNRVNIITSRDKDYKLEFSGDAPSYLHNDLPSALARLNDLGPENKPIHRAFIIGGASLYSESLALSSASSPAFVDRILITRILSPDFEQCDVFMPNFLGKDTEKEGGKWTRASHDGLKEWLDSDVPEEVQEENGVKYEYQMWIRDP